MNTANGPAVTPGRPLTTPPPSRREVIHRVADQPVNQAVAGKLWALHWDYGYLTRAEIEAALGLETPRGEWVCPGRFGADGRYARHCGDAA